MFLQLFGPCEEQVMQFVIFGSRCIAIIRLHHFSMFRAFGTVQYLNYYLKLICHNYFGFIEHAKIVVSYLYWVLLKIWFNESDWMLVIDARTSPILSVRII